MKDNSHFIEINYPLQIKMIDTRCSYCLI